MDRGRCPKRSVSQKEEFVAHCHALPQQHVDLTIKKSKSVKGGFSIRPPLRKTQTTWLV